MRILMGIKWRYIYHWDQKLSLKHIVNVGLHNILNPANGANHVPSQDMVLGLYYMTKERLSPEHKNFRSGYHFLLLKKHIALNEGN
jgi:DNA-directed RNA polymerase subunit beta'